MYKRQVYANLNRCKQWVENIGNPILYDKDINTLNGKYFVCSNHFKVEQFYDSFRKTLLPTAVPTIFPSNSHIEREHAIRASLLTVSSGELTVIVL